MSDQPHPELWRGKTLANQILSAIAGAVFGALGSVILMISEVGSRWILCLPIVIGAVLGAALRDRGVKLMMKLIDTI